MSFQQECSGSMGKFTVIPLLEIFCAGEQAVRTTGMYVLVDKYDP